MKRKLKKGMLGLFLSLAMLIGLLPAAMARADDEWFVGIGMWYLRWVDLDEADESQGELKEGYSMDYINFIEAYNDWGNGPCALLKDEDHGCYYFQSKEFMEEGEFENAAVSWDGEKLTLNNYSVDYTSYVSYFDDFDPNIKFDGDCYPPILEVTNMDATIVVKGDCSITWKQGQALVMLFDEGYTQQSGTLKILKGTDNASLTLSTSGRHTSSEEPEETWALSPLSIGGDASEFFNYVNLTLVMQGKYDPDDWDMDMGGEYPEDRIHNFGTINGIYPLGPDNIYIDEEGYFFGKNEETGGSNELCNYWKINDSGRLARATAQDYQLYYDSENKTLELKDFVYKETQGLPIHAECGLTLKLTGSNKVTAWSGRAIMVGGDLAIVGTGSLEAVTTCEHEINWETGEPGYNGNDPWGATPALSIEGERFSNECTLVFRAHASANADLELWNVTEGNLINTGTIKGRWVTSYAEGTDLPEAQEQEPDPDASPSTEPDPSPSTPPSVSPSTDPSVSPSTPPSSSPSTPPSSSPSTPPSSSPSTPPSSNRPSSGNSNSGSTPVVNWNRTVSDLNSASGENLNVVTGEKVEIPQNVLQTVKAGGTTLILHTGKGVAFSISRENLTDDMIDGGLNLSAIVGDSSIPDELVNQKTSGAVLAREISMVNKSAFGGIVNTHWALGSENSDKYANLYRYNATTGQLEYAGSYIINKDGQAMFGIVDGADYLLTVTDVKPDEKIIVLYTDQYIVAKGDTLSSIATRHNMNLETILALNPNIKNSNRILVGQKIRVR